MLESLSVKAKKNIRNAVIAGGILLGALGGLAGYNSYLCGSMHTDARLERVRDRTLEDVTSSYCGDQQKSASVGACNSEIKSLDGCCGAVIYKIDKKLNGKDVCFERDVDYSYYAIFESWSEDKLYGDRMKDGSCAEKEKIPKKKKKCPWYNPWC